MGRVRETVLKRLPAIDLAADDPLLDQSFLFRMVLQHEYQHNETILQTLQLKTGERYHPVESVPPPVPPKDHPFVEGEMVRFPGGSVDIGTDDRSAAYDNERPRHSVELAPFLIDAIPVTEAAYAAFIDEGGYETRGLWSDEGWAWRNESGVRHPKYWEAGEDGWEIRVMDRLHASDGGRAVCHVCYHEAEAFASFARKRLPTEFEWEAAATWDPGTGTKRSYPWGEEAPRQEFANVDVLAFGPAPAGSYGRNVSPIGCYGMIGDVWEWTSTNFGGYPGYETFPYPEYSEVFFGDEYKVLRGGAWGTRGGPSVGLSGTGIIRFGARSSAGSVVSVISNRSQGILEDIRAGLSRPQKELPSKYFYDTRGSELFEAITELPEYYLTRTETDLLKSPVAGWVVDEAPASLVELGAGSARKTRILLSAMSRGTQNRVYAPVDVAGDFLRATAEALRVEDPSLEVRSQVGDITKSLDFVGDLPGPVLFALS